MTERVLLLDGAMGTMIQRAGLSEEDFRAERFADWSVPLAGDNDVLVLTAPEVVAGIHRQYLEAGADVIETDTFNAQRISQREYHLESFVAEINREAARLARREADRMTLLTPRRPRFVAGSVGPTGRMLSLSADVDDPAARAATFAELAEAYVEQMTALIEGGVDALLIETIFDTLNAKAALHAARRAMTAAGREVEVMLSMTVSDASGRTLSGQTVEAFVTSVSHARPLSIGLNCSLGAAGLLPALRQMASVAPCFVTAHPNAGLPNRFGGYDDTPEQMCSEMADYLNERLVNMIGGCCGTTPAHIAAMRQMLDAADALTAKRRVTLADGRGGWLAGLEPMRIGDGFCVIGERCNVAGSRKFLRLIHESNYDEALVIARRQVEAGARVIDVNMDDGLLNAAAEMRTFLNLLASDPAVARVPVMIDSSRFDVIMAGLECWQGKGIVNSLSLKDGEAKFLERARIIGDFGAAVVIMAFDEEGQATDYERRVAICTRAYRLLVDEAGFDPADIIFDPNVLTVATGMAEHDRYALDFIRATQWIHTHLPATHVSGGLSNLSFAFRGHNYLREAMHAVFLHHATATGMDMAIMNPASAVAYADIADDLRRAIEDVIFARCGEATDRLMAMANTVEHCAAMSADAVSAIAMRPESPASYAPAATVDLTSVATVVSVEDRLVSALVTGDPSRLEQDLAEALTTVASPLEIIAGPLMEGMNTVGRRFGAGEMFLPQVVKTARTMKRAVDILRPHIENTQSATTHSVGRILIATVKGDVHDIGKNIVGVVLGCNNFEIVDLGVMVPAERIVAEALRLHVDIVCLSGLITPSLDEMCRVAEAMQQAGLRIPLMVGGATTSALHTAVKIAPLYDGPVFHLRDAAQNPVVAARWMNPATREALVAEVQEEQARLREAHEVRQVAAAARMSVSTPPAERRLRLDWTNYVPPQPPSWGRRVYPSLPIATVEPLIDWTYFYHAWKVKEGSPEAVSLLADAQQILSAIAHDEAFALRAATTFCRAVGHTDGIEIIISPTGQGEPLFLPTPRQQRPGDEPCLALCDYVSPHSDCLGAFAATVSPAFVERINALRRAGDEYGALLWQTIGDRLAEATAEHLHRTLRGDDAAWPIRPAVGYPSLPDQKAIFLLAQLIDFAALGIQLTENGAMRPLSSVAGLYIAHPAARYFHIHSTVG